MGKQRERNRIKSRVDELPQDAREMLDRMLGDVTNTYAEISEAMGSRGWDISKSSIGRYAMRQNAVARRLKESREQMVALINEVKDNNDVEAYAAHTNYPSSSRFASSSAAARTRSAIRDSNSGSSCI